MRRSRRSTWISRHAVENPHSPRYAAGSHLAEPSGVARVGEARAPTAVGVNLRGFAGVLVSIPGLLLILFLAHPARAVEDPAADIARRAFHLAPKGNWTLSASLSTRPFQRDETADPELAGERAQVRLGSQRLTIRIRVLKSGSREVVYEPADEARLAEGLCFFFPRPNSSSVIRRTKLKSGRPVSDPKALFLGSAFSIEDLSLGFLGWKSQELIGLEQIRDRNCWKITSRPAHSDHSAYGFVESWIDQEYDALLRAVACDAGGRPIKEFNVRSVQQLKEIWMLKRLDLQSPGLQIVSHLEILDAREEE